MPKFPKKLITNEIWRRIKRNGSFRVKKKAMIVEAAKRVPEINPNPMESTANGWQQEVANVSQMEPAIASFMDVVEASKGHAGTTQSAEEGPAGSNVDSKSSMYEFRDHLKTWAITHQIKHTAVNSLLTILKTNIPDNVLPADARTLVKTPAKVQITHDDEMGGEYWHYGLQKVLTKVLMFSKNQSITKISLIVNIDGVPISKSSTSAFWPILVKIHEMDEIAPLVVGIFSGMYKPKDVNSFLRRFVDDMNVLLQHGISINNRAIEVTLRCFVCDTPARAMLRGVIGHNGYASCLKCVTEGEYCYSHGKMIFPELNAALRTDSAFRSRTYEGHHKHDSILEEITRLDMIKDFPIGCEKDY
ncbi:hypothetical protein pipiens_011842 [Culex pipiens pipiens]|uniref:Transposase domain-containing protein n=1 Tax=Culex pipiens pipiens TaxID=38569 RepID=A0ABD1D4Q6_CULPP